MTDIFNPFDVLVWKGVWSLWQHEVKTVQRIRISLTFVVLNQLLKVLASIHTWLRHDKSDDFGVGLKGIYLHFFLHEINNLLCDLSALIVKEVFSVMQIVEKADQVKPLEIVYSMTDNGEYLFHDSLWRRILGLVKVYYIREYPWRGSLANKLNNFWLVLCYKLGQVSIVENNYQRVFRYSINRRAEIRVFDVTGLQLIILGKIHFA